MKDDRVLQISHVLVQEYEALGRPLATQGAEFSSELEARRKDLDKVKKAIDELHAKDPRNPVTALCLSGGGIRSATFCLGALQRLAKEGLLVKFDYLSTVSGGGYIGSWLKAWAKHETGGIVEVQKNLASTTEEPAAVRHLRYYSNYLAPKIGMFSADTWTLIATYLRNLLLNWLVLLPLLMLPLLWPRFDVAFLKGIRDLGVSPGVIFGASGVLLLYGLVRMRLSLPSARGSPALLLTQGGFLRHCLLPSGLAALGFTLWWCLVRANPALQQSVNFWAWINLWGWLPWPMLRPEAFSFLSLLGISVLLFLLALILEIGLRWAPGPQTTALRRPFRQLAASIATAVVAAGLLWAWTQLFAFDPRNQQALFLYALLGFPALLGALTLSEVFYIGVASYFTTDEDREWWARAGAWDLIMMAGWLAASLVVIYGPALIEGWDTIAKAVLGAGGLTAGGVAAKLGQSALTAAEPSADTAGPKAGRRSRWITRVAFAALLVFFAVVLIFLAYAADWLLMAVQCWLEGQCGFDLAHGGVLEASTLAHLGLVAFVLVVISGPMGFFVHVNKFSLHAMYRNRLIRAYLGASRGTRRKPNPFSGFDEDDNIHLKAFRGPDGKIEKPLHVINIALNLVRGEQLAWQERKAESFTASALHCGAYDVGYRRTEHYGGNKGMTLGTAVAISGAAFSPNAGYHSSPLLTLVMSLFNVRLGWWLGNPRHAAAKEPGPRFAATPLLHETFGLTDDRGKWVYLSDGGHFDNLGLYEMVVRRCRRIVVLDSGADADYQFDDLGNAIRKIRADLGVAIDFEQPLRIGKLAEKKADGRYGALFRIRYSGKTGAQADPLDGRLLYIKPAVHGSEPMDIYHYHAANSSFPHQTTADQFFDESQFESYRALGFHQIDALVGTAAPDIESLFASAEKYVK